MSVPAVPILPRLRTPQDPLAILPRGTRKKPKQTGIRSLESKKTPLQRTTLSGELSCVLTLKMTENIVTFLNQGLISKIGRDLWKIFMFKNILKCYLIIYTIYICIQTPVFPTSLVLIFYGLFILSRFRCRSWQLPWFTFRLWSSEQYIALPHFDKKKNAWNWDWAQWSCLLWVLTTW